MQQQELSQLPVADARKANSILKRYILSRFQTISKLRVSINGDSLDIYYCAPEELTELEDFTELLEYGTFDGMNDMYVSKENYQNVILENHILDSYRYVTCKHLSEEGFTVMFETKKVKR